MKWVKMEDMLPPENVMACFVFARKTRKGVEIGCDIGIRKGNRLFLRDFGDVNNEPYKDMIAFAFGFGVEADAQDREALYQEQRKGVQAIIKVFHDEIDLNKVPRLDIFFYGKEEFFVAEHGQEAALAPVTDCKEWALNIKKMNIAD